MTNELIKLLENYPDKPWDWSNLSYNKFKYDPVLEKLHFIRLKRIRKKVKSFKIKNWYKLYLLTKTQAFWVWYCGPNGIGRKVDEKRILETCCSRSTLKSSIKN